MKRVKLNFSEKRDISQHETRTLSVNEWLNVWKIDKTYFDSERNYGYGGYNYDGRWIKIVDDLIVTFNLDQNSTLLDLGCAKGYLVNDYNNNKNVNIAVGLDISIYALMEGKKENMNGELVCGNFTNLPFNENEFSFIFCKDSLHNILDEDEICTAIREINRVGRDSWIRVGAYQSNAQKKVIDDWATLATTYLHVDEWLELFEKCNYQGSYDWFHPSEEL